MLTPHLYVDQVPLAERGADVVVPPRPVPVLVDVRWQDGHRSAHPSTAKAWTSRAVEVRFLGQQHRSYQVWLPVQDVQRA